HESFEDEEVAEVLNRDFIAIKADREERPDIDHIYMTVCQALTGHGGWPLSVFLSPDRIPFYAGTYFPKHDRMGTPGFITLLDKIIEAWRNKRDALLESGSKIIDAISRDHEGNGDIVPDANITSDAFTHFKGDFDVTYGGFGHAPKFPAPHNLYFLLRYWHSTRDASALEMVEKTLDAMRRGGIYDHIGFGFSRYSTDKKWLVPHFEKMLYDNALLAIAYLEAFHVTKKELYADTARQIFTYVLRDMTSPEGGFYSAEDADSEGIEGRFYVWKVDEIEQVLGKNDGGLFCTLFDITEKGNFEGYNIPNLIKGAYPEDQNLFVQKCRELLFNHRENRIHPYKDDKILTAWNGLMIAAMAIGGGILGDEKYTKAAERAFDFIKSKLVREDGRLMARYRDGEAAFPGYADDYSFLIWGLNELYEATYKSEYLLRALSLNSDLLKLFWDESRGGLFVYGSDSEQLIARPKEIYDGATPSGNSVSALNFLRLSRLTGQHELEARAYRLFKAFGSHLSTYPRGYSYFLTALMYAKAASKEVLIVGNGESSKTEALLRVVKDIYNPFTVTMLLDDSHKSIKSVAPFTANYTTVNGVPAAYVCENFACSYPVTDTGLLKEMLQ
ncbi:MAG: thioredoxin domain-containing protein, partial [Ruminiclostridium sp.]|nr:thioredoxin domain-containing protein [Ruminiclostridium sp.]